MDRTTAGSHTVTLCADIPGQVGVVPERSETNNCASETFVVAGTVDLVVTDITITPSRPLPGTPVNVDAIVQNVGGVASLTSSARLDVDRDGDGVFETLVSPDQPVPALAPQATSSVSWLNATDAAAGPMTARVCVDPDNQNPNEASEANCATKDTGRPLFRPGRFREVPS